MKSAAIYWVFAVVAVVLFAAIYWLEININPTIHYPPAPAQPAQNAHDYFIAAETLDRDSDKWNFAAGDHPPGYKDASDPDDRYYSVAEQKALLAENLPVIAKVREGLALPYVPRSTKLFDFEPYSKFREEARLLGFAGKVYGEEGQWNEAMTCELDAVQLGAKVSRGGGVIARLVDIACEAIGRHHAWDAVGHLSAVQARHAGRRLEAIQADRYPLSLTIENEKWSSLRSFDRDFHAKGIDGTIFGLAAGLSPPGSASTAGIYIRMLGMSKRGVVADYAVAIDRAAQRCRYSYGQASTMPALRVPSDPIAAQMVSIFPEVWERDAENDTQNDLLMVTLALHAYKLDHGRYPASLSLLAPAYLSQIPADPFAQSGPLRYRTTPGGYVLYSVGPDGVDDGGKPIVDARETGRYRYLVEQDSKGDIVAGVNIS